MTKAEEHPCIVVFRNEDGRITRTIWREGCPLEVREDYGLENLLHLIGQLAFTARNAIEDRERLKEKSPK